uniref:Uncharacterized protein n=1 Tax=Romanomermis culicivorax TaxID=13658 RepID=A0A915JC40_ROMCU
MNQIAHPTPPIHGKLIFQPIRMTSVASAIGDPALEDRPNEAQTTPTARETIFMKNTYAVYPNHQFPAPWEQHIHYNAVPAPHVTTPTD